MIRISLRDPAGRETASAVVDDPLDAPEKAATMLVGLHRLDPGHILVIDYNETGPHQLPEPGVACVTVNAGNLNSLAARLDAKAGREEVAPRRPIYGLPRGYAVTPSGGSAKAALQSPDRGSTIPTQPGSAGLFLFRPPVATFRLLPPSRIVPQIADGFAASH